MTLGPRGRNVILARGTGGPTITNDGVTIAGEIELGDTFPNQGARFVRQVASATNEIAGDGTTTAVVLAQAIVREGVRNVAAGADPLALRRGIEVAVEQVVRQLRDEQSRKVGDDQIARVAAISSGDDEIGAAISEAIALVGNDGALSIQDGQTLEIDVQLSEGMRIDRGWMTPEMATEPGGQEAVLEYAYILLVDGRLDSGERLGPVLDLARQANAPLLLLADMFDGDVLPTLLTNKARGLLTSVAVANPDFGERRVRTLEDIADRHGRRAAARRAGRGARARGSARARAGAPRGRGRDDDDDHRRQRPQGRDRRAAAPAPGRARPPGNDPFRPGQAS